MPPDAILGVLYPGHSGESDYRALAASLGLEIAMRHTPVGADLHEPDALREIGDPVALADEAQVGFEGSVAAVVWACTSGSFVFGLPGAADQVEYISRRLGVPVTSTSLAFVSALQALRLTRVAIAATYPVGVTALFADFLTAAGVEVDHSSSAGIMSGREVGALGTDEVVDLVQSAATPGVQAILVPDTALRSSEALPILARQVPAVVLTANQVTIWAGRGIMVGAEDEQHAGAADALGALRGVPYRGFDGRTD